MNLATVESVLALWDRIVEDAEARPVDLSPEQAATVRKLFQVESPASPVALLQAAA